MKKVEEVKEKGFRPIALLRHVGRVISELGAVILGYLGFNTVVWVGLIG